MSKITQNLIDCESKRRLFVGCLASYNNGIIHGEWLDLSDYYDLDEAQEKINAILKSSPCEGDEYDIQDYEGFGELLKGGMYPSLTEAWAIHETLNEVEEAGIDTDLFLSFVSANGDCDQIGFIDNFLLGKFQDSYRGCFDSLEDYGYSIANDCAYLEQVPGHLRNYIDFERFAHDMELNSEIFTIETGYRQIHVFSNYY